MSASIEELSGVLTLVADLGDGATEIAYAALGMLALAKILDAFVFVVFLSLLAYFAKWGVTKYLGERTAEHKLQDIRDTVRVGSYGRFNKSEFDEIIRLINRGKKANQ